VKRVVVTGMGAISPYGAGVDLLWQSLLAGKSAARLITEFDTSDFLVKIACEVPDFDSSAVLDRRQQKRMDKYAQIGIMAADEAFKDSGILDNIDLEELGCIAGTGIGGIHELETQIVKCHVADNSRVSPLYIPKMMSNAAVGNISIQYGLKGPTFATGSACASASHGMSVAYKAVALGEVQAILTGGVESSIVPTAIAGFQNMKALSRRNDDPAAASRPFDKDRDGFVMGEGGAMLVFEELEHAKKRGAKIYAEIMGSGATSDALGISASSTDGSGPARSMLISLRANEVDPSRVNYINAHGTSTPLGDVSEIKAAKLAFGDHVKNIAISSTKSMIGHLLGASGAMELIACVKSCQEGKVHATINVDNQDPECDLDVVPNEARDVKVDVAICNSFGFGGHNASIAVARFDG
jgi:3-oxoacyl-[acyl-carrier-protein] synthase II